MNTIDHRISDEDNRVRVDVTRSRDCDTFLLLNIQPLTRLWPRTTAIISLEAATELAQALLDAIAAFQPVVPAGWETVDTDTD